MGELILENLSGKKLTVLAFFLMISQLICFLIGGLIAPSVQWIKGTACRDDRVSYNDTNFFLYTRGPAPCKVLDHSEIEKDSFRMVNQLVFVFQMPLPHEGRTLDDSKWQQSLTGFLKTDIDSEQKIYNEPNTEISLDLKLFYRNKEDPEGDWKYYSSSLEKRDLNCHADNQTDKYMYQCDTIPVFEMGSLHHDFYLLNVRIPVDSDKKMNLDIGYIRDLNLAVIYQNGGFTKVWVSLKTVFFPFIVAIMIWFWHHAHPLQSERYMFDYMLMCLGGALTFLNMPLEYLTLFDEMEFVLLLSQLLSEIRYLGFYTMICLFWLVFLSHFLSIQGPIQRTSLQDFCRSFSPFMVGCVSLLLFEISERGQERAFQMRNQLYTFAGDYFETKIVVERAGIALLAISAVVFFFFVYFMYKVMKAMKNWQDYLRYYTFKSLLLAMLVGAILTIARFILGQACGWQWNKYVHFDIRKACITGMYGMWNIYICALIVLCAPSH